MNPLFIGFRKSNSFFLCCHHVDLQPQTHIIFHKVLRKIPSGTFGAAVREFMLENPKILPRELLLTSTHIRLSMNNWKDGKPQALRSGAINQDFQRKCVVNSVYWLQFTTWIPVNLFFGSYLRRKTTRLCPCLDSQEVKATRWIPQTCAFLTISCCLVWEILLQLTTLPQTKLTISRTRNNV